MKISVITVCLNAKTTIEETFLSIFNQTYKDVELIVIDGASTDGTIEVINKYKDKIAYSLSEPDNGVYEAMNKGINASNGDFIIFLNADDIFYDEHVLEKVAKTLDENPDIDLLFGNAEYISEDKKTSRIQTYEMVKDDFSLIINNICHQSIFYHKKLFEKFDLFSIEYQIFADWDFNLKCLVQNKAFGLYLPIIISKFQLGGICSSSTYKKMCEIEKNKLIKKYYSKLAFLIQAHGFLMRKLKTSYKFLMKVLLIEKLVKSLTSQDKYKLNLNYINTK